MKMFIDCDPGVDDSLAILFALNRPDVEVVGITTSTGNVSAAQGAENALRILMGMGYHQACSYNFCVLVCIQLWSEKRWRCGWIP